MSTYLGPCSSALARHGYDALHARDTDLSGAPDEAHLARATQESRVLISQDSDFLRLHAGGVRHAASSISRSTRL